jgi:hypothetical protein
LYGRSNGYIYGERISLVSRRKKRRLVTMF